MQTRPPPPPAPSESWDSPRLRDGIRRDIDSGEHGRKSRVQLADGPAEDDRSPARRLLVDAKSLGFEPRTNDGDVGCRHAETLCKALRVEPAVILGTATNLHILQELFEVRILR